VRPSQSEGLFYYSTFDDDVIFNGFIRIAPRRRDLIGFY